MEIFSLNKEEITDLYRSLPQKDQEEISELKRKADLLEKQTGIETAKQIPITELGLFHRAVEYNHAISIAKPEDLEEILSLMHNQVLRVVKFIDSALKLEPKLKRSKDPGKEFTFSTGINQLGKNYNLIHKSGYEVNAQNSYADEEGFEPRYQIEINDPVQRRIELDKDREMKVQEESINFELIEAQKNPSLILRAYPEKVIEQKKPNGNKDVFLDNLFTYLSATREQADEEYEIDLSELTIDTHSGYIKDLKTALFSLDF